LSDFTTTAISLSRIQYGYDVAILFTNHVKIFASQEYNNDSCHGWFQARKKASLDAPRPQAAFPIRRRSAHGLKPLSPLDETPLYAKFRCFHASKTNNIHILKTLFGPVIMLDLQVPALAKSPFNLSDSSHAARDCPRNAKP
jgi:hypothetical protein